MNGAELKSLREGLGLSIEQAAAQCEVFVKTWSRWEGVNIVPPGAVKLFRIMNRLDELPPRYVTVRCILGDPTVTQIGVTGATEVTTGRPVAGKAAPDVR